MPSPISLSISSVRSGGISLTEPTRVVLPTPNPPATRIFRADVPSGDRAAGSKPTDAIKYRLQSVDVGGFRVQRSWGRAEVQVALLDEVSYEDLHHREREPQLGADLGERQWVVAEPQDVDVLGVHPRVLVGRGHHQGDQVEVGS